MRETGPFEKALACALVVHAGTLFAFGALRSARGAAALPASDGDPIEIHVEELAAPQAAPDPRGVLPEPGRPEVASQLDRGVASSARAARERRRQNGAGVVGPSPEPVDVAPSESGEPWTFSPTVAEGVWLGLRASPDAPSSLPTGARAGAGGHGVDGAEAPSTSAVADSLRAALDAHDREIGMGAGAPLVEPTREAVRTSLVPDFARAILEFTTDKAGLVVSVRVVDASSDRQAWDEVAEKLALDPRKKPLRMPTGTRGISVTMQVESRVLNASGQDPGQGILSRAAAGLFEPSELMMDSSAKPRRVVVAKVIHEARL